MPRSAIRGQEWGSILRAAWRGRKSLPKDGQMWCQAAMAGDAAHGKLRRSYPDGLQASMGVRRDS